MHPTTRSDIIDVLVKARVFIETKDIARLRSLSNNTIHDIGVFQSKSAMDVAIALYAVSKLMERSNIDTARINMLLHDAEHQLENERQEQFHKTIARLIGLIRQLDRQFSVHVQEVLQEAQVKKGSKLFEHGISVARSAQMFGISRWDLLPYVGQLSNAGMAGKTSMDLSKRLSFTRELFK